MKSKGGLFFALYLVILTVVMCGFSLMSYFKEQSNIQGYLVSPVTVLEEKDRLDLFELMEENMIKESFKETQSKSLVFGSEEFMQNFKSTYIGKFNNQPLMKAYLGDKLKVGETEYALGEEIYPSFVENVLYHVSGDGQNMIFDRTNVIKTIVLNGKDVTKINYPVTFNFEFGKGYRIDKNGNLLKLEKSVNL